MRLLRTSGTRRRSGPKPKWCIASVAADRLGKAALERLAHRIRRVLVDGGIQKAVADGELVHQLCRSMGLLTEHGDAIEEEVFWNSADLFKLDVDLVFYDAATAWFETGDEDVAPWRRRSTG